MDNILLCSNHIPLVTSIHNTFIEKYMLGANGSYVKVYLYLSKCIQAGQEDLSISSLADQMENTEKDVIRALNYWEKKHLLRITRSEDKSLILGIDVLNPDELPDTANKQKKTAASDRTTGSAEDQKASDANSPSDEAVSDAKSAKITTDRILAAATKTPSAEAGSDAQTSAARNALRTAPAPSNEQDKPDSSSGRPTERQHSFRVTAEQTKRLTANHDFCWTCNVVESYLERPVKPGELQLISYLYDNLHFTPELILYLYEYCISLGKTSTSYIQSVAIAWHEKQVQTPEDAQAASTTYNASYTAVSKAFALGRALAVIEKKYVDRWQNQWKMDLSVILEACNRTMLKIQRADFKYTEGILEKWYKNGISTLLDVEKADALFSKQQADKGSSPKKNTGNARNNYASYVQHGLSQDDADALEKKLLQL